MKLSVFAKGKGAYYLFRKRLTIWNMLRDALGKGYRLSLFSLLTAILTIAYVLFPLDILPDFIPLLGWLDDGLIIYLLFRQLNRELSRYANWKTRHNPTESKSK